MSNDNIKPAANGNGFVVAGIVHVETLQEAEDMLESTGVWTNNWPQVERRKEPRVTLVDVPGPMPKDFRVKVIIE